MALKIGLVLLVAVGVGIFFGFDLGRFLTLEALAALEADRSSWVSANPWLASASYFAAYVAITALSLPGAAVMTLAGGAVFGFVWGLGLASLSSTIGATLAFLVARVVLGDWVQRRFENELARINEGIERDGSFYLFTLRLVPLFPFFVVNLVMGMTKIKTFPFYWVSVIGMLPGTAAFVFAGTQLAEIRSIGDVLDPGLIAAFTVLGLLPITAKKTVGWLKARRGDAV